MEMQDNNFQKHHCYMKNRSYNNEFLKLSYKNHDINVFM